MDDPERSEERRLVAEARRGNMTAFETLVKTHQRLIYAVCRRLAGSHQAADDLAQETFVKAYFALSSFQEGLSFVAWLRTIAVNSSLNYLRLRKKEVSLDALGPDGPKAAPVPARGRADEPADEVARREAGRRLREAIDALPPEQRTVFVLRFYENRDYAAIARALGLSLGTVMSRLSRARRKIRSRMAGYL
ncbi:MAG: sigma-70 family RNA polymerase sigma factor [Candidatus Aminicenantes bacterium]|nr:sigma-70 family RNA polymerase sigma factor [Candidatus Aminicenantes bacterium]